VKELTLAIWLRFPVGSELFHLVGAALGLGAGLSLLWGRQVDCEGWDLLSLWRRDWHAVVAHRHTEAKVLDGRSGEMAALGQEVVESKQTSRKMRALTRIHELLSSGQPEQAWSEVQRTRQVLDHFQLGQRDLSRLSQTLVDAERWDEAVAAYDELVERFPAEATVGRLILAELLLDRQRRPAAARHQLSLVAVEDLTGDQPARYRTLQRRAGELLDSGVVELRGKAWDSTSSDAVPADPSA
ncbi:MAG: hypothetical protein ACK5Q5_09575, partial [Planctomycetaceae bacterium]